MAEVKLDDEVMDLDEVAQFLKVGSATIYSLTREGTLPARKVGREWRYLKSEILGWMKEASVEREGIVMRDSFGGEFMSEDGEMKVALWLPLGLEEKGELIAKAAADGTTVSEQVLAFLRDWKNGESLTSESEN